MTGRARKDLAGRIEQAAARPATASTSAAEPAPRAKPVRLSLDLAPAAYRELQEFCAAAAVALERPRVAGADVLRSLLAELREDNDLAARVQGRLSVHRPIAGSPHKSVDGHQQGQAGFRADMEAL